MTNREILAAHILKMRRLRDQILAEARELEKERAELLRSTLAQLDDLTKGRAK